MTRAGGSRTSHPVVEVGRPAALLLGRVTYEMMASAWRRPATGTRPDWMEQREIPFAETIDQVQPVLAGHGPTLLAGLRERIQLELVDRHELRSGAVAVRLRPMRTAS